MTDDRILDHTHGVVSARCAHPDCQTAWRRYSKRWRYERSHGLLRLTDTEPVAEHIAVLRANGWSLRAIAGESGCTTSVVSRIARGEQARIRRQSAASILALDPATLPTTSHESGAPFVNKTGACRRIRALIAIGWPHRILRERSGINTAVVVNQRGDWITRTTHDQIVALYAALSMQPGPSPQSRGWAKALGYLPPLAWDDDRIDDPTYRPEQVAPTPRRRETQIDDVAIDRRLAGDKTVRLSPVEQVEALARWDAAGRARKEFARVTGYQPWRLSRRTKAAS